MCSCSIYFNPKGGRPGVISPQGVDVDPSEFPNDWFEGLEDDMYKARRYNVERNKHKVDLHMFCLLSDAACKQPGSSVCLQYTQQPIANSYSGLLQTKKQKSCHLTLESKVVSYCTCCFSSSESSSGSFSLHTSCIISVQCLDSAKTKPACAHLIFRRKMSACLLLFLSYCFDNGRQS